MRIPRGIQLYRCSTRRLPAWIGTSIPGGRSVLRAAFFAWSILLVLGSPLFGAAIAFIDYPGANPGLAAVVLHQSQGAGVTIDSTNDGDWKPSFNGTPFDSVNGIIIPAAYPTYGQDDVGASGNPGRAFIEVAGRHTQVNPLAGFANGWLALTDISGNGTEANFDLGFVYFPYTERWTAGTVAINGTVVSGNISGVTVVKDPDDPGRWSLSIAGVHSRTSGMLFVVGGDNANSGNALATEARSDGSGWDIISYDQSATFLDNDGDLDGDAGENGAFHFVYLPYNTPHLIGGRVADDGTTLNAVGNFTVVRLALGIYRIQIRDGAGGVLDDTDGLIIASVCKGAAVGTAIDPDDNFIEISYNPAAQAWEVRSFDLDAAIGQDTQFVFAFTQYARPMPEPAVALLMLTGSLMLGRGARRHYAPSTGVIG